MAEAEAVAGTVAEAGTEAEAETEAGTESFDARLARLSPSASTRSVLDHLSLGVSDPDRAVAFYDAVFAPLGYVRTFTHPGAVGYGLPGAKDEAFAVLAAGADARAPGGGCHVAFAAPDREAVDRFHAAAIAAGARDEGAPGPRPHLRRALLRGLRL